jgi:hypothetical protein
MLDMAMVLLLSTAAAWSPIAQCGKDGLVRTCFHEFMYLANPLQLATGGTVSLSSSGCTISKTPSIHPAAQGLSFIPSLLPRHESIFESPVTLEKAYCSIDAEKGDSGWNCSCGITASHYLSIAPLAERDDPNHKLSQDKWMESASHCTIEF